MPESAGWLWVGRAIPVGLGLLVGVPILLSLWPVYLDSARFLPWWAVACVVVATPLLWHLIDAGMSRVLKRPTWPRRLAAWWRDPWGSP